MASRTAKLEIVPSIDGKHFVRVVAANGETVMVSEGYDAKASAKKAAQRLKRIVAKAAITEGTL